MSLLQTCYNSLRKKLEFISVMKRKLPFTSWIKDVLRNAFSCVILLPEKFLPFDWLRAEVFQLNLKYLHVKITVTMVTHNHQIISSHELRKNGGKISRFWNQEIQELKENLGNQNTEKSTSTWLSVWTSWAENKNFKTNLLANEAKQLEENKHMTLDGWISQVVV